MLIEIKPYLVWMHDNPNWAGVITFLISFLESLAVVGLLFPGTVVMTAVGSLIGTGILPFTSITLWAIAGAFLGDIFSFWLGYYYRDGTRKIWPFRAYPHMLEKGEKFFILHGGKSIFIGRFIGPMRPLLPIIAGMMRMPPAQFLFADFIASVAWAPSYMLPGIILGIASKELPAETATRLLLLIVFALLVFWCISWLLQRLYSGFRLIIKQWLRKTWHIIQEKPSLHFLKSLLCYADHPHSPNQLALALLFILTSCAFILLAISVTHHGILIAWNKPIYYFMRSIRTTLLDPIMVSISVVGALQIGIMWCAVLLWLAFKRYWWAALHWLGIGIVCLFCGEVIKHWIHFLRPTGLFKTPSGFSFPSGHVLVCITFFGFLAVLITTNRERIWRVACYSVVAVLVLSMIFSRLYLGAHWLTDVIGSLLLGFSIISLFTISYRRHHVGKIAPGAFFVILVLSTLAATFPAITHSYRIALQNYTPTWTIEKISSEKWWQQTNKKPPLFRTNRFGKPIQVINVQWAGDLPQIESELIKQNWNTLPRTSLTTLLSELAITRQDQSLPLLNQFYEDRKPVLVMFKYIEAPQKTVLVLRLWDAHLMLDNDQPLWLGTINYHRTWQPNLFARNKKTHLTTISASILLANDLTQFNWRRINYPQVELPLNTFDPQWDQSVLLIKSK